MSAQPHSRSQLIEELSHALAALNTDEFSPGELIPQLSQQDAWNKYLQDRSLHEQTAMIGRFLAANGVLPVRRDQRRGSLYSNLPVLKQLRQGQRLETSVLPAPAREKKRVVEKAATAVSLADIEPNPAEITERRRSRVETSPVPTAALPDAMPATAKNGEAAAEWPTEPENNSPASAAEVQTAATPIPIKQAAGEQPEAPDTPFISPMPASAAMPMATAQAASAAQSGAAAQSVTMAPSPAMAHPGAGTQPAAIPMVAANATPAAKAMPAAGATGWLPGGGGMLPPAWAPGASVPAAPMPMNTSQMPGMQAMALSTGGGWPGGSGYGQPTGMVEGLDLPGDAGARRELPLAFYWQQVRRHWVKILAATLLVTALVGIHMRRIPKQYGSTATVRISASLAGGSGLTSGAYSGDYLDNLQTLMATIMSDVVTPSVVSEAIRAGKLDRDPALNPASAPLSRQALKSQIGGAISVSAVPSTRNFQISAVAGTPQAAADIANAVAEGLINHEFQTRLRAMNKSNAWMKQQLGDLKAKLEKNQQALLNYQRQKALLNPKDQETLMQQRMMQINRELGTIQAERFRYQANAQAVEGNSLNALLTTSIAQSTIGQSLAAALNAEQKARAAFDAIKMHDGPANPAYIQAQQQYAVAGQQLQRLRQEAASQIAILYSKARDQENLLRQALQSGQLKQANFNAHALDYNLLSEQAQNSQQLYNALQQQFDAANLTASFHGEMLRVVNPATPDSVPVYPDVRRDVTLAFLMSLLGGCMLAIGLGYLDRSLKSPEDVSQLGLNFLGALPQADKAIAVRKPFTGMGGEAMENVQPSAFDEAVLSLRTAVMLSPGASEARTFTITSSLPGEGKSTILAHMAIAMSLHGIKTVLVDAEMRRPQIHLLLDVPNRQGLSEVLRGGADPAESVLPTAFNNLWVLPSGGRVPNPSQLLHTGLPGLLEQLKKDYQVIFIDSPPLLGFSETLLVDSLADMVLVVVLAGKTRREQVRAMLQQLRRIRANVIGGVLNQVQQGMSPYYSHYDRDYYAYGRDELSEERI